LRSLTRNFPIVFSFSVSRQLHSPHFLNTQKAFFSDQHSMKALVFKAYGGPEVQAVMEVPKPKSPQAGELLVKMKACSFNPIDFKRRGGLMKMISPETKWPVIMGYDGSGIVEEVGSGVTRFKPGDEIYCRDKTHGTACEYAIVLDNITARKPVGISFEEAAALPLAALTALQMLRKANFKAGDKIFVSVGAGGVGHFAIQLARAKGASHITSSASGPKVEIVKGLGADHVFDYKSDKIETLPKDFDVVLDMAGEVEKLMPLLKPGGSIVSVTQAFNSTTFEDVGIPVNFIVRTYLWFTSRSLYNMAYYANVNLAGLLLRPNKEDLEELTQLVEARKLRVILTDNVFQGLDKAPEAMAKLESGRVTGKVAVTIG